MNLKFGALAIVLSAFAGVLFPYKISAASPTAGTEGPCNLAFQKLVPEQKPAALKWRRPKQSVAAKKAQAAKVTDLSRLRKSTRVLSTSNTNHADALVQLEDGIYVWGIDSRGHVVILNRNLNPNGRNPSPQFLGSHSGLMRVLQNEFGKDSQFLATGEIVRRNGRTMLIDNSSGTYPGGAENLDYGIKQLKSRGLPIDERTVVKNRAEDRATDPHDAAYIQVPIETRVLTDPELRGVYRETRRVMKKVDEKFSDGMAFYRAFRRAIENGTIPESVDEISAPYMVERWQNTSEGTAYIFESVYRNTKDPEEFQEMLRALEKIADSEKPN